ncbi:MAG: TolC family protein [Phycisphaerales bacterium]
MPLFAAAAVAMALSGCSRPFRDAADDPLARVVAETATREALPSPDDPREIALEQTETPVERALAPRRTELDLLGPQAIDAGPGLDVGLDLLGNPAREATLGLREAIVAAVENNLSVQIARIDQAVSQAEVVKAEAIFDAVVFAGTGFARTDQPGQQVFVTEPNTGAKVEVNPGGQDQRLFTYEAGLSQFLPSGGTVSVTAGGSRNENLLTGLTLSPNPDWDSSLTLSIAQPLLRGFGSDVNTARIALARNEDRRSLQNLRERLLAIVADTERAYWNLVLARQELVIRRWLVDVGEDVRDILERRQQLDVTLADFADAVATVESRKAEVIRSERRVAVAVDELKRIINDPRFPLGSEITIVPRDWMVSTPLQYSLPEALATAVRESPAVQKSVLAIDDASIRELVADNGRLPQLDLAAEMAYFGQSGDFGPAWSEVGDANFIDYVVGLQFSQPIGNRAAEAEYRQARLRRSSAVLRYREAVQNTVFAVRVALRDIVAGWRLIAQARSFRIAQAENLRALAVLERTRASLTPEFLNLKFQRQNGLALAQFEEVAALVNYNIAIAELQRAMGTGLEMNRIELSTPDAVATAR